MRSNVLIFATVALISTSLPAQAQNPKKLIIGSEIESPVLNVTEAVLIEAYQKAGIPIKIIRFPAARSLNETNRGIIDGQANRIKGIENNFPNLVMIPVPVQTVELWTFTKNLNLTINGWESLKPHKIAYIRGNQLVKKNTVTMQTYALGSNRQVLKFLALGRADIGVLAYLDGLGYLNQLKIKDVKPLKRIQKIDLYHYLHKKHQKLIPTITAALAEMSKNGRMRAIRERYIATELNSLAD